MTRTVTTLPVTEKTVGPEWNGSQGNWDNDRIPITEIIIHTMDGTAVSADARFNNPSSDVAAHYGVLLDGSIWHWVDEDKVAYHAGDYGVNQCSIGIEHEDNGDYNGVRPDVLYQSSARLVRDICNFYNIPIDRTHIKKHSEVSDKPTACPDALDIDKIVSLAANNADSVIVELQQQLAEANKQKDETYNQLQTALHDKSDLQTQLTAELTKEQDLRTSNASITKLDEDTGAQLLDAQHKLTDATNALQAIANALQTSVDLTSILTKIDELRTPVEVQVKPLQKHAFSLQKALDALIYKREPQIKSWFSKLWK